jgi:hypothetical protein
VVRQGAGCALPRNDSAGVANDWRGAGSRARNPAPQFCRRGPSVGARPFRTSVSRRGASRRKSNRGHVILRRGSCAQAHNEAVTS